MNIFELFMFLIWATLIHWLSTYLSGETGVSIYVALDSLLWITILLVYRWEHKKQWSRSYSGALKSKRDVFEKVMFLFILNIGVLGSQMAVAFSAQHATRPITSSEGHFLFAWFFVVLLGVQGTILGRAMAPGRPR
jgi:hypothetical protein